jgi:hypothetical protein
MLSDARFADGSYAVGSFVFDADLDVYSDVSIITGRTSYETAGVFYDFIGPGHNLLLIEDRTEDNTGKRLLWISWGVRVPAPFGEHMPPLTNAGGTIPLDTFSGAPGGIGEDICSVPDCHGIMTAASTRIISGSVTTVPEPTVLTLLALGMTALTAARRWRSKGQDRCAPQR